MKHYVFTTLMALLALLFVASIADQAYAQGEVNVYSSRHYDTDDQLYKLFTEKTGIKVNIIEGDTDALLTRIKREGQLSPADVFIAVDAGRLHQAVEAHVLQPVTSNVLSEKIPASLRHPEGLWFGLSKRVRVILVPKDAPEGYITTYEALADPTHNNQVLIRSSQNIYNQSLLASIIANDGLAKAQQWANGVVANMARTPQGGDTDQIRALAAGEGKIAVANHYYFARMIARDNAEDQAAAAKVKLVFPNQQGRGAHVNISGAGVLKHAPNRAQALALMEFLTSDEAQAIYAVANFEYPVVKGVKLSPVLESFGAFKEDTLNAAELGENNREAVKVMDRAGWR